MLAFPSQGWDDKSQSYDPDWRPVTADWVRLKDSFQHVFTHFTAEIDVYIATLNSTITPAISPAITPAIKLGAIGNLSDVQWTNIDELYLPSLMQKAWLLAG